MKQDFLLSSYNYQLPQNLIAQAPAVPRDNSRLLIVNSRSKPTHANFYDLANWLKPGDLLVLNNTRVIPARLYGHKPTGSQVEILLIEERQDNCWLALVKPGKRFNLGAKIIFDSISDCAARTSKADRKSRDSAYSSGDPTPPDNWQLQGTVVAKDEATGGRIIQFELPPDKSLWHVLDDYGQLPLPPYITNEAAAANDSYQTIYAQQPGAIAAPTAGLHFTSELFDSESANSCQNSSH